MALAISLSYSASVEMAAMSFKSSSWSSCPSPPASCLSRWSTWLYRRPSPVHLGHLLVHHGHSQEVWSGLPPSLLLFGTNPPPNCIPPLKDFSSIEQVALHGFKVFCQVVTMLSLRSSKGGQKWSIKRSPSYSKEVPKLLTTEVMKTGKRKFHLQIDFFYSLDELAVDLVLLFVLPFCPINRPTDSLGRDAIRDTFVPQKNFRPTFSSSEPAPSTLVVSHSQTSASSYCWWPALAVSSNQIPRHSLLSKLVVCDPLSPSSTWADKSHLRAPFLEKNDCSRLSKSALDQDCRLCWSPNDKSGSPAIATGPPDSPR